MYQNEGARASAYALTTRSWTGPGRLATDSGVRESVEGVPAAALAAFAGRSCIASEILSASREVKIEPNSAVPTEAPISRKQAFVEVAVPASGGAPEDWMTRTMRCMPRTRAQ